MRDHYEQHVKELEEVTFKNIDLFKGQAEARESAYLTLGIIVLKWINDTKRKYEWNLPEEMNWENLRTVIKSENDFLVNIKQIENDNCELKGIFTELCFRYITHIYLSYWDVIIDSYSSLDLLENEKALSIFFDRFMEWIDNTTGKLSGEFTSPESIKKLLPSLLNPQTNAIQKKSVADIAVGSGGFLVGVKKFLDSKEIDWNTMKYYGQDINASTSALARLNLLMHGMKNVDISIKRSDSLKNPYVDQEGKLKKYDYIISQYPFNLQYRDNNGEFENDKFKRYRPGTSSLRYADWIFNQHIISSLKENGKAVVVATKGSLIRTPEAKIRSYIIEEDLIESVILLPPSLCYGTAIPIAVIIFNKNKPEWKKGKVQFIDSSKYFIKVENNRNVLTDENISKIVTTYKDGIEEEGYSAFIDRSQIKDAEYNLNSTSYIGTNLIKNKMEDTLLLKDVLIEKIKRGVSITNKQVEELEKTNQSATHYYINIKDIEDGQINYDGAKKIQVDNKILEKGKILPGDIIITAKGYGIKIALVEQYARDAVISNNLLIIRVNPNLYDSKVLKAYLVSPLGRRLLEGLQTGAATIKVITPKNLEKLSIPYVEKEKMMWLSQKIDYKEMKYKEIIKKAEELYKMETEEIYKELGIKDIIRDLEKNKENQKDKNVWILNDIS